MRFGDLPSPPHVAGLLFALALLLAPALLVTAQTAVPLPTSAEITVDTGCTGVMFLNITYNIAPPPPTFVTIEVVIIRPPQMDLHILFTDTDGDDSFERNVTSVPATAGYGYVVTVRLDNNGRIAVLGNVSGVQPPCTTTTATTEGAPTDTSTVTTTITTPTTTETTTPTTTTTTTTATTTTSTTTTTTAATTATTTTTNATTATATTPPNNTTTTTTTTPTNVTAAPPAPLNTPAPPAPNVVVPVAPLDDDLSGGAIAGIVIGSVAGVALIAAALFFLCRGGGGGGGGPGVVAVSAPAAPPAAPCAGPVAGRTTAPFV